MQYLGENSESKTRVNVLKKVKVNRSWKLCPAVVERSGKLKDRVHINGRAEVHSEGVYYIEWRESNQRRRQAIPNRNEVLERARLKGLELDAGKASIKFTSLQRAPRLTLPPPATKMNTVNATNGDAARIGGFAGGFLQGLESCLHNFIGSAVRSHLAALGMPSETTMETCLALNSKSLDCQVQDLGEQKRAQASDDTGTSQQADSKILIAEAIESYLKDVEPPQREQKTYDEYRLVLYKFRDSCEKKYLKDINRDDCLSFMRHLYSIRNEARTVFNRMGIVQQLLKLARHHWPVAGAR